MRSWAQIAAGAPASGAAALGPKHDAKDIIASHTVDTASPQSSVPNVDCKVLQVVQAQVDDGVAAVEILAKSRGKGAAHKLAEPRSGNAEPSLEDSRTAKCVSGVAVLPSLASVPSVDDVCHASDLSSTAASELEGSSSADDANHQSCILCSGSGFLCVGRLSDPCPLCDPAGEATEQDEKPEATSSKAVADGHKHDMPPTQAEDTDSFEVVAHAEESQQEAAAQPKEAIAERVHVVSAAGTALTAPPGIGPPGIWLWPKSSSKPRRTESDATASDSNADTVSESHVDSPEVEFLRKIAVLVFGPDFIKMTVSWSGQSVQGEAALPSANVQLHLEPIAFTSFLTPLTRFQAVLARDQMLHQCHIFRIDRAIDGDSMAMMCAKVSVGTCWDVLKKGFCPRPSCLWEHPPPRRLNVCCVGGPAVPQPALATLMPKPFDSHTVLDKTAKPFVGDTVLNAKAKPFVAETVFDETQAQKCTALPPSCRPNDQLICMNLGAYDFMSDSSDEM